MIVDPRFAGRPRPQTVGGVSSALLHGVALLALLWGHPALTGVAREVHDDEGLLTVAVIGDTGDHQHPRLPPLDRQAEPEPGRPGGEKTAARHARARAVARVTARRPRRTRAPPLPAPPEVTSEQAAPAAAAPAAAAVAIPPPARPGRLDQPAAPARPVLLPDVARSLRVYDVFPTMPAAAGPHFARAERAQLVEVCVSDRGAVSEAVIAQRGDDAFDRTLRAAILTWRYRPLTIDGRPTPFCHKLRVSYRLN